MGRSSHYTTLGLEPKATQAQIKRAYRDLAKALHPDVNKASDAAKRFARVAAAYEILGDAAKRKAYDQSLREPKSRPAEPTTPVDLRAHYTWTNIAAHGAEEAAKANKEAEIDELYETFFATGGRQPPAAGKKARTRRSAG